MKIETKAVEVLLNGNHILKGIDLNINDRELVGIIGPTAAENLRCSNVFTGY